MNLSKVDYSLQKDVIGYVCNAKCSRALVECIATLQNDFKTAFGDAVYCPEYGALHITLLDWIAPLVDFGTDKDTLFQQIQGEYVAAFQSIVKEHSPFQVMFSRYELFDTCVILKGTDNGIFQNIRDGFSSQITPVTGNKPPPTIIHSTVVGFRASIDLDIAKDIIEHHSISFGETITEFRLVRETKPRHQIYEELQLFPL